MNKKTLRLPVSYASTPLYAAIALAEKTSSLFLRYLQVITIY